MKWPIGNNRAKKHFRLILVSLVMLLAGCGGGGGDLIPAFTTQSGVAADDFDGDGRIDFVMATTFLSGAPPHPGFLLLYLQRSDQAGAFLPAESYPIGSDPWQIAVADITADGLPDVVTANPGGSSVSVLINDQRAPGTFLTAQNYACASGGYALAVGDLNGDGLHDIAVAVQKDPPGGVSLLFQNPDLRGDFLPATQWVTGFAGLAVAICDLNGDALNDLVLTGVNFVSVLLQDPVNPGTFLDGPRYPTGQRASYVMVADINGDGRPDIMVANAGASSDGSGSSVSILEQDPSSAGTFYPAVSYTVANGARSLAVGDLNGDGRPDIALVSLVYSSRQSSRITLLFQDPDEPGGFLSGPEYTGGFSSNFIVVQDFNGDGRLDILVNDGPLVFFQDPSSPGGFLPASQLFG
jgi:hypothetical protein